MQTRHANSAPTVVGYQTSNATNGYQLGAITFNGIATSAIDIQDIKPIFPEGETPCDDMFSLQIFNAGAGCAQQWGYYVKGGDWEATETGWYPMYDTTEKAVYPFKEGEGFMFQSAYPDNSGAGYTIAGQVAKGTATIEVDSGYTLIGNIRPTNVSIQDITPIFPEGTAPCDDMFSLQIFNAGAGCAQQWGYYVKDGDWEAEETGWYPMYDTSAKAEYTFNPGEGFMFQSAFGDISTYEKGKCAKVEFKSILD